jgi:hypothetical protein
VSGNTRVYQGKIMCKIINKIIAVISVLIVFNSCGTAKDKSAYTGLIYESHSIAMISNFDLVIEKNKIFITYPKYKCKNIKYNINELGTSLSSECIILDNYLKNRKINVPNENCTDIYISNNKNDSISTKLVNTKTPCFSFSKDLRGILLKGKDKHIEILQFYSSYGLFQAEVSFLESKVIKK